MLENSEIHRNLLCNKPKGIYCAGVFLSPRVACENFFVGLLYKAVKCINRREGNNSYEK